MEFEGRGAAGRGAGGLAGWLALRGRWVTLPNAAAGAGDEDDLALEVGGHDVRLFLEQLGRERMAEIAIEQSRRGSS